jgi:hypothetical protein
MSEAWLPVVGAEDFYEVSSIGRVRSLHKIGRRAKGGFLQQQPNKKGYLRVRLTLPGRSFTRVVNRLVLEAFVGAPLSSIHESNHKNGIKSDNRVSNLEWVTPVENNAHSVANGFWHPHKGEAHGMAKITEEVVRDIRNDSTLTNKEWGELLGLTTTAIYWIRKRKNWKHVK